MLTSPVILASSPAMLPCPGLAEQLLSGTNKAEKDKKQWWRSTGSEDFFWEVARVTATHMVC